MLSCIIFGYRTHFGFGYGGSQLPLCLIQQRVTGINVKGALELFSVRLFLRLATCSLKMNAFRSTSIASN